MSDKYLLTSADYGILSIMLIVSALIGLYFQIFGGKQKTNEEYLFGGKDMSIFPVAFSLFSTFLSAVTLMGLPAEMYTFGTNMAFMNFGFILGPVIASYLFLPIYFKTGVSTPYEYLEKRFGKSTRRILSIMFLLDQVLFSGVSLYAPAVALTAITSLSMMESVILVGGICTFYSTLGGMKAVLWADVFQSFLMYTCLFSIIIKGCLDLGGISAIFKTAYDDGRILLPTFKMDFSVRYTMWSIFLQSVIITTVNYGGYQMQVQKLLTLKNLKRSKISSLLSIPILVIFQLLCCFCGIIFYVHFRSCDPVSSLEHPIQSYDQLLPYYIVSTMKSYPGLPGLCIAGIFSASLSSISSAVNSMAAVTYEDIIRPIWTNIQRDVLITKFASVFYGVLIIVVTFLVESLGNLIKASILTIGAIAGAALGVFFLASLTTTANEMGVNIGVVTGMVFAGVITFISRNRYYPRLPIQNTCSGNFTEKTNLSVLLEDLYFSNISNFSTTKTTPKPEITDNFPLSYMWFSSLTLIICLGIGYFGSWIISCIQETSKPIPSELLSPIRQRFYTQYRNVQMKSSEKKILEGTSVTTF